MVSGADVGVIAMIFNPNVFLKRNQLMRVQPYLLPEGPSQMLRPTQPHPGRSSPHSKSDVLRPFASYHQDRRYDPESLGPFA